MLTKLSDSCFKQTAAVGSWAVEPLCAPLTPQWKKRRGSTEVRHAHIKPDVSGLKSLIIVTGYPTGLTAPMAVTTPELHLQRGPPSHSGLFKTTQKAPSDPLPTEPDRVEPEENTAPSGQTTAFLSQNSSSERLSAG